MHQNAEIPVRSRFWLKPKIGFLGSFHLFDSITIAYSVLLAQLSLIIFWPIIYQIEFEEAFFTPLVPFLINLFKAFGLNAPDSIKIIIVGSFMMSTVGIYLFVRELTRRHVTPILAALIYLLPPIPVFTLTFIRRGLLDAELASAKSFFMVVYGDGAHFLALALIPFACIFFLRYLKRNHAHNLVFSVLLCSLILLTNRTHALNLFIILGVLSLTELFLDQTKIKINRLLQVLFLSVGVVSFWYTPSYWYISILSFGQLLIDNIKYLFPLPFIIASLALLFSFVFFARREARQLIFLSFLLVAIFLSIAGSWYFTHHSFVPHPYRILSLINMFGAITLAIFFNAIIQRLNLGQYIRLERLSSAYRTAAALLFSILSFALLAIGAYTLSPLVIILFSGPGGIWTKVSENVLAERFVTLKIAGGNFVLFNPGSPSWQYGVGIALSVFFTLYLLYYWYSREGRAVLNLKSS